MGSASGIVLCLAYVLGLLATAIPWGGGVVLVLGIVAAVAVPRLWSTAPRSRIWLAAGAIALLASLYYLVRVPQPQANDISKLIPANDATLVQELVVRGQVDEMPHLTRSQKIQFWLTVQQVSGGGQPGNKPTTGKLYVTVPQNAVSDLHPGQTVSITGTLYKPKPATNPGGFDFQNYLAQEGSFAGLRGKQVEVVDRGPNWGWWAVQQRIQQAQQQGAGSPEGPLISAMVMGNRSVDIPFDLKDQFTRAGLAHALAASGFQTSLILGVVLALTYRWSEWVQFGVGTAALGIFVGLTGLQPAVLRAALMGFGGLIALILGRKVRPLGSLLVTAVILLFINPLWIWSLSFQLSFLATLGLLVTVPAIAQWLYWMPSALGPVIAVPLAAYLWTLPLQLYSFGVVSPYSILVNILTTPLISLLSIGGMISALAGLIWFPAGIWTAAFLKYPAQALIFIVNVFTHLPGNAYAVGTISAGIAIALYALVGLTWLQDWWQKRWWAALILGLGLVFIPAWQVKATQYRATVLATTQPVLILQEGDRTGLINSGDAATAGFSILPFLQKEGVNQVDWAISLREDSNASPNTPAESASGWSKILEQMPVKNAYGVLTANSRLPLANSKATRRPASFTSLSAGQTAKLGSTQLQLISPEPLLATLQMRDQNWLWLGSVPMEQQAKLVKAGKFSQTQVLLWSGRRLRPEVIATLKPKIAIAVTNKVDADTSDRLQKAGTRLYWTGRDGALQWTPQEGVKTTLESGENSPAAL